MAKKLINQMGMPKSILNIFTARNIITTKDALSHTEFELMELLDIGKEEVTSAMVHISGIVCKIRISLLQQQVKLLIIGSMAALVLGEHDSGASRQQALGWHVSFINTKPLSTGNSLCPYRLQLGSFHLLSRVEPWDSHLVAALGINWAHAVTVRLVREARSGQRFIKLAKSPISPPLAFLFKITSSGLVLLDDEGIEMEGPEINTIHCQGLSLSSLAVSSAEYSVQKMLKMLEPELM